MRDYRELLFDNDAATDTGPHTQVLEQLSMVVRSIYCLMMRQVTNNPDYGKSSLGKWDGTTAEDSPWGSRSEPVWPKIAKTIISCEADPLMFISSQFYGIKRASPPRPNQLYNEAAVGRWEEYRYRNEERLKQQIDSDFNQIKVRTLPFTVNLKWDNARALNYVLREDEGGISPLVCYCAATAESLPIAAAYRERALLQYLFQKDVYDRLLPNCVPAEMQEEATELRRRLIPQ